MSSKKMSYSGKYKLSVPEKYLGNPYKIVYRSLWEKQTMKFLESCVNVIKWSSEVPIQYICSTDGLIHRYYVDLYIELDDGKKLLIEIKPYKQTLEPKVPLRKTRKYLKECMVYAKNHSKWKYARMFCEEHGMEFQIWDEHFLRNQLGLKIL